MYGSLILTDLLQQVWFMNPAYADTFKPLVLSLLKGDQLNSQQTFEDERIRRQSFAIENASLQSSGRYANYNEAPENSIAVHSLIGPVIKRSQWCGPTGTMEIAESLKKADKHPNIGAHILIMESGGGAANALQVINQAIDAAKKPVVVYSEDILCSAALGIAVHGDEIIMNHPNSIVGSIGTMLTLMDWKEYFDKEGIKIHEIYADESTRKNAIFHEALSGKYEGVKGQLLNPWNKSFISDVKASREGKLVVANKIIFTGETFNAQEAMDEHGLIDHIGNFDFAIERASELMHQGRSNSSSASQQVSNSNSNMSILNKFPKLTALIGKPSAEITSAMMDEVNAELKEKGVNMTLLTEAALQEQITAETTALNNQLATATASAKTANDRILAAAKAVDPNATAESAASIDLAAKITDLKNADAGEEGKLKAEADRKEEQGDGSNYKPQPVSSIQR